MARIASVRLGVTGDLPGFFGRLISGRSLFDVKEEPMRKSRFGDGQMIAILREADRTTVTAATDHNHRPPLDAVEMSPEGV